MILKPSPYRFLFPLGIGQFIFVREPHFKHSRWSTVVDQERFKTIALDQVVLRHPFSQVCPSFDCCAVYKQTERVISST